MIGSQIALLRQKHGLRQAELAALLNISPSTVAATGSEQAKIAALEGAVYLSPKVYNP